MAGKVLGAWEVTATDLAVPTAATKPGDVGCVRVSGRGSVTIRAKSNHDDTTGFSVQVFQRPASDPNLTDMEEIAKDWFSDDSEGAQLLVTLADLTGGNRASKGIIIPLDNPDEVDLYARVFDMTGATKAVKLVITGST